MDANERAEKIIEHLRHNFREDSRDFIATTISDAEKEAEEQGYLLGLSHHCNPGKGCQCLSSSDGFRAGQEQMREEAAKVVAMFSFSEGSLIDLCAKIRALAVEDK